MNKIQSIILVAISLTVLVPSLIHCQVKESRPNVWELQKLDAPYPYTKFLPGKYYGPELKERNPKKVSAIIIHSTKGLPAWEFLTNSWKSGWNVHLLVDKNGVVNGEMYPGNFIYPTAPGLDDVAIHIALEGTSYEAKKNTTQWNQTIKLVQALVKQYNIPKNNYDVGSKKGIFTHIQSKKRFGGFINLKSFGEETMLSQLLKEIGGKYYPETQWKDRYKPIWVARKENSKAIRAAFKPNRGRGITATPKAELKSLEQTKSGKVLEKYRVRYVHRGKIKPSCVVLHYTAIPSFFQSLKVLEDRSLTASIMVDNDGKGYQLLDTLNDFASAAYGTNDHCVQIEIVGRGTPDLMKNSAQTKKVVEIVKELSKKYNFPLSNHKIESFRGVFSHNQAKKKFGGSSYLIGKDFDPGEEYMEKVLKLAGGKFYSEENWFERKSEKWVILDREFQP
ncbi:MAG: N-acetylmuramoyl-L-alanine amidase [Leptospira sp.]|nr:N-acetylmuramoyl-L-alanine amidase [Leptospira sp.]